ncbi:MAG: uncharacterized protein KVP18_002825, partial [Porospora cf. gigantea A]
MMSGRKSAELFIQMKGVDAISFLMRKTTQVTLIQFEGYRNIIAMLNYFPPPEKEVADEWDDFDVADEEVSPKTHRVRRGLHPRSWQALKMSVEGINALIDSILSTLKDENNQRALRVFFCGVGLLAYFAVEKIPGTVVTFYQSDFATPIVAIQHMFMREYDLSRMITILVGNLAYASDVEMLMLLFQNRDLSDILTRVNNVVPKSERPLKQDVALLAALLNEKLTASNAMTLLNHRRFESLMQYDFDWALTRWNTDRYPNGVQDLPPTIKLQIREGGKLTAMKKGDAQARSFHWKSSSDMTRLQWRWGDSKAGQFDDSIGASRIKTVAKQALSP